MESPASPLDPVSSLAPELHVTSQPENEQNDPAVVLGASIHQSFSPSAESNGGGRPLSWNSSDEMAPEQRHSSEEFTREKRLRSGSRSYSIEPCCSKIARRSPRLLSSDVKSDLLATSPIQGRLRSRNTSAGSSTNHGNGDQTKMRRGRNSSEIVQEEHMETKKRYKSVSFFVGEPIPEEEARERWRWRYELKSQRSKDQSWKLNADEEDEIILNVRCHYAQAKVGRNIFNPGDCAYIKGDGKQKHIGRIMEFFQTTDGDDYFRVQWFFRAEDTVMKQQASFHNKKRLFSSTVMNDNPLDCIISKVNVVQQPLALGIKPMSLSPSDFYYDMEYSVEYSTFRTLSDNPLDKYELSSDDKVEAFGNMMTHSSLENILTCEPLKDEFALLDLYSGCGGMSTGLCLGAKLSRVNLVTKWAVDGSRSACDSLKMNHPEAQVRHENAEDFLELLKEWEKLCGKYVFNSSNSTDGSILEERKIVDDELPMVNKTSAGEYEVLHIVDICYGDPYETGKQGVKFKVRWKGYSSSDDTWEPIEGLGNCLECLEEFVRCGFKSKLLPLPGDVDVLCGGPPCQGISGYNRFRNTTSPLEDERNRQIIVFMDIVKFLKPKYVLMENVTDILKFDKASLARYALSRLVHMNYQARMGTMAAGCYGLPQFRLRVFFWGALLTEKLPQFPLPTHDVIVRYWPPTEFQQNTVAYNEGEHPDLEEALVLRDAISDLPSVSAKEMSEQMSYVKPPESEFQKFIRLTKDEMVGCTPSGLENATKSLLYDHQNYLVSEDNYLRICQIPHKKGANFRDFPGVLVGHNNVVYRDPTKDIIKLPSGNPLVPDYVFTFEDGKSKRPFGRLWWDETVPTVVTFPDNRSQVALHPEQDRPLTTREYARLQGFPDFYRFSGTIKERYRQVGNAVAVNVSRALGYGLGMAIQKIGGNSPLMKLPPKFAHQTRPTDEVQQL
ncbi:DNA (cytosine-5)-methyltransferase CMT2-like isoform X2 [Impatiens glandulifera]|uniref:DNA (cytosine-5)-methyltransferase CMT2-like isoform X2 n=1 Tax=Impatiens glandulifera TaxID=253017 RepID=UPI001FB0CA96|nr:DNA (cytosine-5)-methyltransferase CMT2-like isoform X2 [Impatiens glandulifera]